MAAGRSGIGPGPAEPMCETGSGPLESSDHLGAALPQRGGRPSGRSTNTWAGCVGRAHPVGCSSAPEATSSHGRRSGSLISPATSMSSAAAPSGAPSSGRSLRTELPRVVLLENGTEDEKASAGDHRHGLPRAHPRPGSRVEDGEKVRVVIVHHAIPADPARGRPRCGS